MSALDRAGPEQAIADLGIVIVTYNSSAFIDACLASLRRARPDGPGVVIQVVDSASTDDTVTRIRAGDPAVAVTALPENRGFAHACNRGMQALDSRYVLLVNPDLELAGPEVLQRMVAFMDAHPRVGLAGCRLVFPNGAHQIGDAGHRPGLATLFAHASLLSRLFPARCPGLFLTRLPRRDGWIPVDWISGAFVLVRREAIAEVGGLDERFFLYGEDVEWGCRITDAGWRGAYLPALEVLHHQGGSAPAAAPATRWIDGLARAYHRLNPRAHWWPFKACLLLWFALRVALYALRAVTGGAVGSASRVGEMCAYLRHAWRIDPGVRHFPDSPDA